mmetsp:Transcript_10302/g.43854  ORF Transcript_10302/g.43854 Transcript_10302/m.43854 type:complete len:338 (-) Transcript_10302:522-1535(-)
MSTDASTRQSSKRCLSTGPARAWSLTYSLHAVFNSCSLTVSVSCAKSLSERLSTANESSKKSLLCSRAERTFSFFSKRAKALRASRLSRFFSLPDFFSFSFATTSAPAEASAAAAASANRPSQSSARAFASATAAQCGATAEMSRTERNTPRAVAATLREDEDASLSSASSLFVPPFPSAARNALVLTRRAPTEAPSTLWRRRLASAPPSTRVRSSTSAAARAASPASRRASAAVPPASSDPDPESAASRNSARAASNAPRRIRHVPARRRARRNEGSAASAARQSRSAARTSDAAATARREPFETRASSPATIFSNAPPRAFGALTFIRRAAARLA